MCVQQLKGRMARSLAQAMLMTLFLFSASAAIGEASLEVRFDDAGTPTIFKLDELDSLRQLSFRTSTIWTDGTIEFSGVPLKALLEHLNAKGRVIELIALNDYAVQLPFESLEEGAPLIATRLDGHVLPVRDKGPFWVVYPYDHDPKYSTETVFSRSIWQLSRVVVIQ